MFYLIISRRFPIVSFWQNLNNFHNLYRHSNHITDFPWVFSSYTFCSIITLCFISSEWLPERLYICHRWGFSGLYILLAPSFCKFLCLLWTSYFVYTGSPFFPIFWFFRLLLAISTAMSLSAMLFFWHLSLHIFKESFSFSFWVFHYHSLFEFRQVFVSLFVRCLSVSAFLFSKSFHFFYFWFFCRVHSEFVL